MTLVDDHKPEFNKIIEHYREELATLRTGRATPALIENVVVEAYGSRLPLKQTGSINVSDAKSMTVEPWDKNLLKDIERAIAAANLGLSAANEGAHIRVTVPQMTEETRKELVKLLKDKSEHARIAIRGLRDKVRETIITQEKDKEITEDDKYSLQKNLDELTGKYNDQIKELTDSKEKEIMTV
jgi:ribosome recycling factor